MPLLSVGVPPSSPWGKICARAGEVCSQIPPLSSYALSRVFHFHLEQAQEGTVELFPWNNLQWGALKDSGGLSGVPKFPLAPLAAWGFARY